eukprot:8482136-Pyramimonas_sp.AAC.1
MGTGPTASGQLSFERSSVLRTGGLLFPSAGVTPDTADIRSQRCILTGATLRVAGARWQMAETTT